LNGCFRILAATIQLIVTAAVSNRLNPRHRLDPLLSATTTMLIAMVFTYVITRGIPFLHRLAKEAFGGDDIAAFAQQETTVLAAILAGERFLHFQ
jgi:hypothetical protein